jgi:hypothetical protein
VSDFSEDEMLYAPDRIVPARGRKGLADTDITSQNFTERELDLIAPLEPDDPIDIARDHIPNSETIARFDSRIQAARRLKYGG